MIFDFCFEKITPAVIQRMNCDGEAVRIKTELLVSRFYNNPSKRG